MYGILQNFLKIYFYCFQLHVSCYKSEEQEGNTSFTESLELFSVWKALLWCLSWKKKKILTSWKGIQDWGLGKADQWEKT